MQRVTTAAEPRYMHYRKYITYCTVIREASSPTQLQRVENFLKFGHVVFETFEWTDRPTDSQTNMQTRWSQYCAHLPGRSNNNHARGRNKVFVAADTAIFAPLRSCSININHSGNVVIFAPSAIGLQDTCSKFAKTHNVVFNVTKSQCFIVRFLLSSDYSASVSPLWICFALHWKL